jgi:hypothetical protein
VSAPLRAGPANATAAFSFASIKIHDAPEALRIQPKLVVGSPDDTYEREADRVSRVVANIFPHDGMTAVYGGDGEALMQRKCSDCEKKEEEMKISRKPSGESSGMQVRPETADEIRSMSGGGSPLKPSTRSFMEGRFGADFGQVRVHTDSKAARLSSELGALAFTVGSDIMFAQGRYSPASEAGIQLLAHELTHVVQQGSGPHSIQRAETDTAGSCSGLADSAADVNTRVNTALANARRAAGATPTGAAVARGLYRELAANSLRRWGRSLIELWAEGLGASKVRLPSQSSTKYAGVTYVLWSNPLFPILNPTMRVNGICIGSDKLGHFLQQGYEYFFDYFSTATSTAAGEAAAEAYGESTEAGGYGLHTTGVFSNADLEANRRGLQFYRDLDASPGMTFDIANYINSNWNEESNPSFYEASVGRTVWSNLLAGSWAGGFTLSSPGVSRGINVTLAVTGGTRVTGSYTYSDGTSTIGGTITGTITHLTNARGAVTGVRINFDWQEGAATGKGIWTSANESTLRGTWGNGTSDSNGGDWDISK